MARNQILDIVGARDMAVMEEILNVLKTGKGSDEAKRLIADVWVPVLKFQDPKKVTSIYFCMIAENYNTYREIAEISKDYAKAYLILKTIYVGKDMNPFKRIDQHMIGNVTNFDKFCRASSEKNVKLKWVYIKFDGDANSFYAAFELIGIAFANSFKRPALLNELLGEKIKDTHILSGFDDEQRPTIMSWLLDQTFFVR